MQKQNKKMLPLLALAGCIAVLGVVLAVLKLTGAETTDATAEEIPLFDWSVEEISAISYAGNSNEAVLLKGTEGNWMLESDPTLPLTQDTVQSLAENLVSLTALRQLSDSERGEIPAQSDAATLEFSVTAGETTHTLMFDALNTVANVYYVYDETGAVYTVHAADVSSLTPTVKSLYAPQTLTEQAADDVVTMQVDNLAFRKMDDVWTLLDDPDFALDQDAVTKMARTICELQTSWTVTAPEADSVYGLDAPEVVLTFAFADGTRLIAEYGAAVAGDDSACYLQTDAAPGVIYEVPAVGKATFAVTKESLAAAEDATGETADTTANIVAESPVGGVNDYADAAK